MEPAFLKWEGDYWASGRNVEAFLDGASATVFSVLRLGPGIWVAGRAKKMQKPASLFESQGEAAEEEKCGNHVQN